MNNKLLIEAGALRQYMSNTGEGPYIAAWDLEITNRVVAHLEARLLAAQPAEGSAQVATDEQENMVQCDSALRAEPASLHDSILGAVARGWCSPANAHKVMDTDLVYAITREVEAKLATRCRAEGGVTCDKSGSVIAAEGATQAGEQELTEKFALAIVMEQEGAMTPTCVFCGGDQNADDGPEHEPDCTYVTADAYLSSQRDGDKQGAQGDANAGS